MIGLLKVGLEAFNLAGLTTKLIIIGGMLLSLMTAGGIVYHHIWRNGEQYGYQKALKDIARQDANAIATATTYRNSFRDCRARGMRWDTGTGKCDGG